MTNEELLVSLSAKIGIELSEDQSAKFMLYKDLLASWNEKMNLTAISDENEVVTKHFIDSLTLLAYCKIPEEASVIDVGTGAGFPGIAMKIARPDLTVLLLDSLAKRVVFLNELIISLKLEGITAVHERAEDGGRQPELRENFDIATSRAVAKLSVLCEYCLPYVKQGGLFIAMKGSEVADELEDAKAAISQLGAKLVNHISITLPQSDIKRNLLVIKKIRQTPRKYPRNQAQITKNPII